MSVADPQDQAVTIPATRNSIQSPDRVTPHLRQNALEDRWNWSGVKAHRTLDVDKQQFFVAKFFASSLVRLVTMATEPPFILLKSTSWLPVEEAQTLLGAVVKNLWAPTDNSVPTDPRVYDKGRKFVEKEYNDFVLSNQDGAGMAAKLKLQGLTKLIWKGEVDDDFDLRGKHIRYIKLRQVDKFWEDLKQDSEVRKTVPNWIGSWNLRSKPPVCLITGIFICKDAASKSSKDSSQDCEAKLEAPFGTAAVAASASQGVLLPNDGTGNLEAGFSANKTQKQRVKAKAKGDSIFAMQLRVISSETFNRTALRLKDKSPDAPTYRQMGEDEELPFMDSLNLEEIDPETWESWDQYEAKFVPGATYFSDDDASSLESHPVATGILSDVDESMLALYFEDVIAAIDQLFGLAPHMRSPSCRKLRTDVDIYQEIDAGVKFNYIRNKEAAELRDIEQVFLQTRKSSLDPGDEDLDAQVGPEDIPRVRRLQKANHLRRQQFEYWKRSKIKSVKATTKAEQNSDFPITGETPRLDAQAEGVVQPAFSVTQTSQQMISLPLPVPMVRRVLEPTENDPTSSGASRGLTDHGPSGENLNWPKPPYLKGYDRDFECPYCFFICPSEYLSEVAWRYAAPVLHAYYSSS